MPSSAMWNGSFHPPDDAGTRRQLLPYPLASACSEELDSNLTYSEVFYNDKRVE